MSVTVNIGEAKTNFSKLLSSVQKGSDVIIANRGVPMAKIEPIEKNEKRSLGFVNAKLPDSFFDKISAEELSLWNM